MKRRTTIAALALALALALLFNARPGSAQTGDRALSPEEIRALVARAVANQRRNDAAPIRPVDLFNRNIGVKEHTQR